MKFKHPLHRKTVRKTNSTTPDDRVLQRCLKTRTPKDVYTQRGQASVKCQFFVDGYLFMDKCEMSFIT